MLLLNVTDVSLSDSEMTYIRRGVKLCSLTRCLVSF